MGSGGGPKRRLQRFGNVNPSLGATQASYIYGSGGGSGSGMKNYDQVNGVGGTKGEYGDHKPPDEVEQEFSEPRGDKERMGYGSYPVQFAPVNDVITECGVGYVEPDGSLVLSDEKCMPDVLKALSFGQSLPAAIDAAMEKAWY